MSKLRSYEMCPRMLQINSLSFTSVYSDKTLAVFTHMCGYWWVKVKGSQYSKVLPQSVAVIMLLHLIMSFVLWHLSQSNYVLIKGWGNPYP